MAITTLPTFEDDEILTAGKLNELRDAIEDKFTGAITGADLAWPLVAQGNLDMSSFSLLGVRNFRSIYDSSQYASLQAAINVAEAAGGGVVLIPAGTEYEVQGITIESDDVILMGHGDSSVIKLPAGATSSLISVAAQVSGIRFIGLKFDGNSGTGTDQHGITLQRTVDTQIIDCTFDDFSGHSVYVTNAGTAGQPSTNVKILRSRFSAGESAHVLVDDGDDVEIRSCKSDTAGAGGFHAIPASASAYTRGITIDSCYVASPTGVGIAVQGSGASAVAVQTKCHVVSCAVDSASDDGIQMGIASALISKSSVRGCGVAGAGAEGIEMLAEDSVLSENIVTGCTGTGIDLLTSTRLAVSGNVSEDNTAADWDVADVTTSEFGSGNINLPTPDYVWTNIVPGDTFGTSGSSTTYTTTVDIPAGTFQNGSIFKIIVRMDSEATGSDSGSGNTLNIALDGADGPTETYEFTAGTTINYFIATVAVHLSGTANGTLVEMGGSFTTLDVDWSTDVTVSIDVAIDAAATGINVNTILKAILIEEG